MPGFPLTHCRLSIKISPLGIFPIRRRKFIFMGNTAYFNKSMSTQGGGVFNLTEVYFPRIFGRKKVPSCLWGTQREMLTSPFPLQGGEVERGKVKFSSSQVANLPCEAWGQPSSWLPQAQPRPTPDRAPTPCFLPQPLRHLVHFSTSLIFKPPKNNNI